MFSKVVPQYVEEFLDALSGSLEEKQAGTGLTRLQRLWLGVCLMGIVVTESVCWARFERASLGACSQAALSWMFRKARIPWHRLLHHGVEVVLRRYGVSSGVLGIDDTERRRAKQTSRIHLAHKLKDKKTGGYINGQSILFVLLVTPKVTVPVDFAFYMPDPRYSAWSKEDERLRRQKVPKKDRPPEPCRDPRYPTKQQLALELLYRFKREHPSIKVQAVLADALYGTGTLSEEANKAFGTQFISQLRKDQNVEFRGKELQVQDYFNRVNPGVWHKLTLRGHKDVRACISSARLQVCAHEKKRFVVAIKYEGESEYRYLFATNLSWRTEDIVRTYSLRWLVEVFIEDWKLYEGWGRLAKQTGEDGSGRGLILSLLLDHCLLLHPEQTARVEDKLSACTVGSLRERLRIESIVECFRHLLGSSAPGHNLDRLREAIEEFFPLRPSTKHLAPVDIGRLEPTPSLRYRAEPVAASS